MVPRQAFGPSTRLVGFSAEARAARFLRRQGLRVIARNFQCRRGEIDLILEDRALTLIFAEVRFRRSDDYGGAAASVSYRKQCRIKLAAAQYLLRHPWLRTRACRFDVIAARSDKPGKLNFEWIPNAFC